MADEETKTETTETVEPTDKREGILDYIKGAFKRDETVEEVEDSTETKEEFVRSEAVPSEFVDAAKADGWTDKDIEDFAKNKTDEDLVELSSQFTEEEEEEEIEAEEPAKAEEPKDQDWKAIVSSLREEIRNEILSELGPKFESLDDFKAEQQDRQTVEMFETANEIMDGASKDLPVFGTWDGMPKFKSGSRQGQAVPTSNEFKARSEVYDMAVGLLEAGRSNNINDAMDDALAWYRGKYGQKEMERKVVRNLKKQESKLSGARTGKETKKEFESTRDEITDYIRQQQKALGLDT